MRPRSGTPTVTQLLGVNDLNQAAGFYTGTDGNNHGFIYNIANNTFTPDNGPRRRSSRI